MERVVARARVSGFPSRRGSLACSAAQTGALGLIFRDLSVHPYREYDVSAWVRSPPGVQAKGKLSAHDGTENAYAETAYACEVQGWSQLRLPFLASQTGVLRVHLVRSPAPAS